MSYDAHYHRAPYCRAAAIGAGWADVNTRGGSCEWLAGCGHMASRYVSHPVLGDVPVCLCCAMLIDAYRQVTPAP